MKRRTLPLLIAGAMALTTLTACASEHPRRDVARTKAPAEGREYVAIGDSYTAAPGTGPVSAEDGCLQSTTNYPHQVARRLRLRLTDVSCGGASTLDVTRRERLGIIDHPPQGDAVTRATDLVTISLGANDFRTFFLVVTGCPVLRPRDPEGTPCTNADLVDGKSLIARRTAVVERRLVKVIRLVRSRAPRAQILVVGYPQIFPATGPCAQLPFATGDYAFARRINTMLVAAQKQAAATAKVAFVDVFAASKGHDMCGSEPWVAGVAPTVPGVLPYHPYSREQRLVADLLVDRLG